MIECGNERCSEYGHCTLWNECPLFKVATGKKKPVRPGITEDSEQETVVKYCQLIGAKIVHVPNEGKRTKTYGAKMKALGLSKGFPDLFLPIAKKGFHGLLIELKRDRSCHPTKEQVEWIKYLNGQGYFAVVCYGALAAMEEIRKYLGVKRHEHF